MQQDNIENLKSKYGNLWKDLSKNGLNCQKCSVYANRLCSQCKDCKRSEDGSSIDCQKCQQIKAKLRSECSICQNEFVLCDSQQVDEQKPVQETEADKDESTVIQKMKEIEQSLKEKIQEKFSLFSLKVDGLKNKEGTDKPEVNNFMSQFSG